MDLYTPAAKVFSWMHLSLLIQVKHDMLMILLMISCLLFILQFSTLLLLLNVFNIANANTPAACYILNFSSRSTTTAIYVGGDCELSLSVFLYNIVLVAYNIYNPVITYMMHIIRILVLVAYKD